MEIKTVKTIELKPAKYNPRKDLKQGDPEYEQLKRSIQEFGYVEPIVINKDRTVIGGHQRLKVLMDLGESSVQVVVVDLDKTAEKALNVALNKIKGDWDMEQLAIVLEELKEEDFDISLTGFDATEPDLGSIEDPSEHWNGMPEFDQQEQMGVKSVIVHFNTWEDVNEFSSLVGTKVNEKTKYIWFPRQQNADLKDLQYHSQVE